jgi:hypothetical protein
MDRLFSLRGVVTMIAIVIVGNLLAGLLSLAALSLVNLAVKHSDVSETVIWGTVGSIIAAALIALGRRPRPPTRCFPPAAKGTGGGSTCACLARGWHAPRAAEPNPLLCKGILRWALLGSNQ